MLAPKPIPLRQGLPTHYGGQSGYKKLCQFLGVPTSKAQADLADRIRDEGDERSGLAGEKRGPNKPTGKKQRHKLAIEAFYGDPARRLRRWKQFAQDGLRERDRGPCFEHRALARFFEVFEGKDARPLDADCPNYGDVGALCAIIPRLDDAVLQPWRLPAVRAWTVLRNGLPRVLDDRACVPDAALAVATILEDARVLEWCVDEGLMDRDALSFAHSGIGSDQWDWLGEFRKDEVADLTGMAWAAVVAATRKVIAELADVTARAGKEPYSAAQLREWAKLVADVAFYADGLRRAWPEAYALQLATHPDAVAAEVGSVLHDVVTEHEMSWLETHSGQVGALWKLVYFSDDGEGLDGLHVGLKRFGRELHSAAKSLREALERMSSVNSQYAKLQGLASQDPLNTDVDDQMSNVLDRLRQAQASVQKGRQAVLTALAPEGSVFASGEDYESKWNNFAEAAADNLDSEADVAAADGSARMTANEEDPGSEEKRLAAENDRLVAENEELRARIAEKDATIHKTEDNLAQAKENLRAVNEYSVESSGSNPAAGISATNVPKTVEEAWKHARVRWRQQLLFGRDVEDGIRKLAHNAGPPKKVIHHLAGLAAYCDLMVGQGNDERPLSNWLNEQNIESSPLAAGSPRPVYHDPIQGQRAEFEMHTKPNSHTSPDRCVRIYYRYDRNSNMIAIGWIGRHPV